MHAASGSVSSFQALVIGYHGCAREYGLKVLCGEAYPDPSTNKYDWLGNGLYFWENDYDRALSWAQDHYGTENAFVFGALISLGRCLNLLEESSLRLLPKAYQTLKEAAEKAGRPMLSNKKPADGGGFLLRDLDCAVINTLHESLRVQGKPTFDTVRGAFQEGPELYPGTDFRGKNHIQLCVRNPQAILGFFLPLKEHDYPKWAL